MDVSTCFICGNPDMKQIFASTGVGFTLAQKPNDIATTSALLCTRCSHVQTPPLEDLAAYYDDGYEFQLHDTDEDDIYTVTRDGKTVFRTEHQAYGVTQKCALTPGLRVLDYGCGKARSLQGLMQLTPDLTPFTFDVSDAYVPLWDRFVPRENQATYRISEAWQDSMDLVLSFFALEHTADAPGFVADLAAVLRPGGQVHVVIPNMYRNISDLVVVDHVHHFSAPSLRQLFAQAGFHDIQIDTEIHRAAFVVNARFDPTHVADAPSRDNTTELQQTARRIARQWADIATRITDFEAAHPQAPAVIYGSGVYGSFIANTLRKRNAVTAFLDANPFRQGRQVMTIPILAPDHIPHDTQVVYVGLNPQDAREIIAQVPALHTAQRDYFYL